jgi:hypothetical protein
MRQIAMILCLLLLAATSLGHAESLIIDSDKQFQFAELLFNKGDYPRAITEYNRFIHFFPDDDRIGTALFQTAMAHRLNNQFNEAIKGFQVVIQRSPKDTLAVRSHFLISACYVKLNDPMSARQILMILLNNHEDSDVRDAAKYRIAWIDIETGHFKQAMDQIQLISGTDSPWLPVQELSADLTEAAALPEKDPALAGALSVVPGAGYVYCGRYQDGLMAFLLNGALIWAAVESFSDGNPALGCVISVVESGFYIGNIYGGINAAHKYNTRQKQTVIDRLKSGFRIGMSPSSDKAGWQFNLQHDF